jgi:hypothetical protein
MLATAGAMALNNGRLTPNEIRANLSQPLEGR